MEVEENKNGVPQDEAKIHSLYIKPSSWERLGIVKRHLNLSYTETIDLLVGHAINQEVLSEDAIKELHDSGLFKAEDTKRLEILGLGGRWKEAALLLKDLLENLQKINTNLSLLTETVEDHAETMILKELE
jgi:hypothetical protein